MAARSEEGVEEEIEEVEVVEVKSRVKIVPGVVTPIIGAGSVPKRIVCAIGVELSDTSKKHVTAKQMGQQKAQNQEVGEDADLQFLEGVEEEGVIPDLVKGVRRRKRSRDMPRC